MLRLKVWPNGEYNTHDYGTVTNAAEFAWLNAYSPVQHVRPGAAYPAVLLIAGENDPRVPSWQSGKFAAMLQVSVKLFGRDMTKQSALMHILEDQQEHLGQSIAYRAAAGWFRLGPSRSAAG